MLATYDKIVVNNKITIQKAKNEDKQWGIETNNKDNHLSIAQIFTETTYKISSLIYFKSCLYDIYTKWSIFYNMGKTNFIIINIYY